jgi:hypothetical protein
VPLIPASDQHQELRRIVANIPRHAGRRSALNSSAGGLLPGVSQVFRYHGRKLLQAAVQLLLGLGQGGQRVDAQEQGAGLGVGRVQDFDNAWSVERGA